MADYRCCSQSPEIKFLIPQEPRLVPKVIGIALLIKVLGHARTEESIFFFDVRLLPVAPPFTLGSRAAPEAQTPSLAGNFTMCDMSKGERKGREGASAVCQF